MTIDEIIIQIDDLLGQAWNLGMTVDVLSIPYDSYIKFQHEMGSQARYIGVQGYQGSHTLHATNTYYDSPYGRVMLQPGNGAVKEIQKKNDEALKNLLED